MLQKMSRRRSVSVLLILLVLLFMQPYLLKVKATEENGTTRFMTNKYQYTDPFADGLSGYYYITAPERMMIGSPISVDFDVVDLTRTPDTVDLLKVILKHGSGIALSKKGSSFSSCTTITFNGETEVDTISIDEIGETSNQFETSVGSLIDIAAVLEVVAKEDVWFDLALYSESGDVIYEYKYDITDQIVDGQDDYSFIQAEGSIGFTTLLVGPFSSDMEQYVQLYEAGEVNSLFHVEVTDNVEIEKIGDVTGPNTDPEVYTNDTGQSLYYSSSLLTKFDGNEGEIRITSSTTRNLAINDTNGERIVEGGYMTQGIGFYLMDGEVTLSDYVLPVTPTVEPTKAPIITSSPMHQDNVPVINQEAPSKNNTALMIAGGIVAVIVACGGLLTTFIRINIEDYKEVISLLDQNGSPINTTNNLTLSTDMDASTDNHINRIKYPFLYIKFRKYTYILGQMDMDGRSKLIRKVKLKFKSKNKLSIDLTKDMKNDIYRIYRIRHPRKAMKHKKDITIAYLYQEGIIEQDHFASMTDYIHTKIIEK